MNDDLHSIANESNEVVRIERITHHIARIREGMDEMRRGQDELRASMKQLADALTRLTLPIAMDFTAARQAAGVVSSSNGSIVGSFNADTTNDQILITANATTTSSTIVQFSGTYTLA